MSRPTRAVIAVLAALTLASCAAPSAGEGDATSTSTVSSSSAATASESSSAASSATSTPAATPTASTGSVAPQPGAEPWPPELILSDILEAGTTTATVGKVSVQIPAGFAGSAGQPLTYTSKLPGTAGPATVVLSTMPASGDALATLQAASSWARTAQVEIPNATSAAMGDAVVDGQQTWGLVVVDSGGVATLMTVQAAPQDFAAYLLYQSVCSIKVAG